MECRFTYTAREYRRAVAAHHRLNLTKNVLICIFFWLVFSAIFENSGSDESAPDFFPLYWIPIVFTIYCLTPVRSFAGSLFFYRNPLRNQIMTYGMDDAGFTLQTPVMAQSAAWSVIGRAGETDTGFMLFWGKSKRRFIWLPKSGFSAKDDIIGCRNLIMKSVRHYKQIRSRRSLVLRVIGSRAGGSTR